MLALASKFITRDPEHSLERFSPSKLKGQDLSQLELSCLLLKDKEGRFVLAQQLLHHSFLEYLPIPEQLGPMSARAMTNLAMVLWHIN